MSGAEEGRARATPGQSRLVALGVIAGLLLSGGCSGLLTQAAGASTSIPYTDTSAAGVLGLCNQQGQQIYSGNINTVPFAWRAVSSIPAPAVVAGTGRTATLYAYQPIEGVDAPYWSGEQLTGSTVYSNPAFPTVVATTRDSSLSNFLNAFHPMWDGFVELRIYLDAPGTESYVQSYPVLNLQISGDTWKAVGGKTVNCDSGQAESDETILNVVPGSTSTTAPAPGSGATSDPVTTTTTHATTQGKSGSSKPGTGTARSASRRDKAEALTGLTSHGSGGASPLVLGVAVAAVVIALSSAVVIRRRRAAK